MVETVWLVQRIIKLELMTSTSRNQPTLDMDSNLPLSIRLLGEYKNINENSQTISDSQIKDVVKDYWMVISNRVSSMGYVKLYL